jgi:integrase
MSHVQQRTRYKRGTVEPGTRDGAKVWLFRWSERVDGKRHWHVEYIGDTKQYPTEAAANKAADYMRFRLNERTDNLKPITFGFLINHWTEHELPNLAKTTRKYHGYNVKNWVEPAWHDKAARDMKTMQIEAWLHSLPVSAGTMTKLKGLMSTIFSHGVRWELVDRNPVCGQGGTPGHRGASTGVRQSARSTFKRITLPPEIVKKVLEQLPFREAVLCLLDAVTALRASELMAIQWHDIQWKERTLKSVRAVTLGEIKLSTKSQDNPLPLGKPILDALRLWRQHTPYRAESDWIFASPFRHGAMPYTSQILFRRHIRPIIEKLMGIKSSKQAPIGWHTFRRSLATLLISNGENVKVTQTQLRHSTPKLTLELYAQSVSADQQKAHAKVLRMVLPTKLSTKLKVKAAAAKA